MKLTRSGGDDCDPSGLLPEHDPERTKKNHRLTKCQVMSRDEPDSSHVGLCEAHYHSTKLISISCAIIVVWYRDIHNPTRTRRMCSSPQGARQKLILMQLTFEVTFTMNGISEVSEERRRVTNW